MLRPQRWNNLRVYLILSKDILDQVDTIITILYSQGPMLEEPQQRSASRGFLSLPLELHRVIYHHLLIPSPIVTMKRKAYDIEPAILLTNKQINEQASWVLYQENDWVLLSICAPFRTSLEGWHLEDALQRYPIVPLAETSFTRTPRLELDIRKMGAMVKGTARRNLKRFVVSLDGLPRVCQILTAARNTSRLEIIVKFAREEKANTMENIMDCLKEACEFGSVAVEGLDATATKQAITKLVMPEVSTQEQILERINRYEAHIAEHIAGGRYIQAMKACQDGMACIEFVCKSADYRRLNPPFPRHPIYLKFTNFALKHAWCCLEYGDHQCARQILSLFLGSVSQGSFYDKTFSTNSEGFYYYGLSLWAGGAAHAAVFNFFVTLAVDNDHEGANEALDAMEARVALRGSDAGTIHIRRKLQKLNTWRRGDIHDGHIARSLIAEFVGSKEEKEPLILGRRRELLIDTIDSLPSPNSAFIFCGGMRVLQDEI